MVTHQVPKKLATRCVRHLTRAEQDIFALIGDLQCVVTDDTPLSIEEVDRKLSVIMEQLAMVSDRLYDELREIAAKGGGA